MRCPRRFPREIRLRANEKRAATRRPRATVIRKRFDRGRWRQEGATGQGQDGRGRAVPLELGADLGSLQPRHRIGPSDGRHLAQHPRLHIGKDERHSTAHRSSTTHPSSPRTGGYITWDPWIKISPRAGAPEPPPPGGQSLLHHVLGRGLADAGCAILTLKPIRIIYVTWDFSTDWSRGGDTLATPNLNGWPVQTAMNAASRTLKSQFHQFETQYLALTDGLVHVRLDR